MNLSYLSWEIEWNFLDTIREMVWSIAKPGSFPAYNLSNCTMTPQEHRLVSSSLQILVWLHWVTQSILFQPINVLQSLFWTPRLGQSNKLLYTTHIIHFKSFSGKAVNVSYLLLHRFQDFFLCFATLRYLDRLARTCWWDRLANMVPISTECCKCWQWQCSLYILTRHCCGTFVVSLYQSLNMYPHISSMSQSCVRSADRDYPVSSPMPPTVTFHMITRNGGTPNSTPNIQEDTNSHPHSNGISKPKTNGITKAEKVTSARRQRQRLRDAEDTDLVILVLKAARQRIELDDFLKQRHRPSEEEADRQAKQRIRERAERVARAEREWEQRVRREILEQKRRRSDDGPKPAGMAPEIYRRGRRGFKWSKRVRKASQ